MIHPLSTDLQIPELHYAALFDAMPGHHVLIKADAPRYTILAATASHLAQTGRTKESVVGLGTFEAFPASAADAANTGVSALEASYQHVLTKKEFHSLPVQRYDLQSEDGSFSERHWRAGNSPVFGADGEVAYIIHSSEDITAEVKTQAQEEKIKGLEQAYQLFRQAPFAIYIITGPELVIDLANPPTLELWGKTEDVTGKRFLDVLPELKDQGYDTMIQEVMQTSTPRFFYEVPLQLNRPGKEPVGYFNFIYQPYYKQDVLKADGVLIIANEVTKQVLAKQQALQNEQSLRLAVEIGQLGVFSIDLKKGLATYSQQVVDWFGYTEPVLPLSQITTKIHPDDQAVVNETVERSIAGEWDGRHDLVYRVLHPKLRTVQYLRSIGQVMCDEDGVPLRLSGIIQDITKQVTAQKTLEESEARFRNMIEQAPVAILLSRGEDVVIESINAPMLRFMNKQSADELLGKTMLEALPELEGQPALQTVIDVQKTGTPFRGDEQPVDLLINGKLERRHFNFSYTSLAEEGRHAAVLHVAIDVTEQVLARRKVEESEAKLNNIVEQTPAPTLVLRGGDFRIEHINGPMMAMVGRSEEVIGQSLLAVMPELEGQFAWQQAQRVYREGISFDQPEVRVPHNRTGTMQDYYYNVAYRPLKEDGRITGIVQVSIDVTEQVASRKKLEASEHLLRDMVMQSPSGICIVSGNPLRAEVVNDAFLLISGKTREAFETLPYWKVVKEIEHIYSAKLEGVFATGESFEVHSEKIVLLRNGRQQTGYFNFIYVPLKGSGGAVDKVMIFVTDVTSQRLARQKIEESEQNFRNLVMKAPVGIGIVSGDPLMLEMANDTFLEIIGKSRDVFDRVPYWEVNKEAATYYEPILRNAFVTGDTYYAQEHEIMLIRKGKEEIVYVSFVYDPIIELDGTVQKVMILALEVTEQAKARKQVEETVALRTQELAQANKALQATNKELQRSNANLEEFAHAASHDLKEPVRKIHFFTHQLREQLGDRLKENEVRSFGRIENATERMGNLIDDLLLYSHVSQRPHETEPVDLGQKVQRVLEDLELDIQEKKAVIHVDQLPVVNGHRRQLQQMFQNLISNALKYSRAGVPPHINITTGKTTVDGRQYHLITVQDNGIGFEQQYADKIFQMFARLHGKTEYSGTGVGLSIVKKVVENHHGFIRVESEPEKGATFRIFLLT